MVWESCLLEKAGSKQHANYKLEWILMGTSNYLDRWLGNPHQKFITIRICNSHTVSKTATSCTQAVWPGQSAVNMFKRYFFAILGVSEQCTSLLLCFTAWVHSLLWLSVKLSSSFVPRLHLAHARRMGLVSQVGLTGVIVKAGLDWTHWLDYGLDYELSFGLRCLMQVVLKLLFKVPWTLAKAY